MTEKLHGRIILVTGASSGLGLATAAALAKQGAHVVMMARNEQRGIEALDKVKAGNPNAIVDLMICDLGNLAVVRAFAADFIKKYNHLDVLINNAGIITRRREETADGFEYQLGVNHLSHFLLTLLLLDLLKKSAPARIINVSSAAHRIGQIHFDDLQLTKDFTPFKAYSQSKLANILFTYELAERLNDTLVTVNALHPGTVRTHFGFNRKKERHTVLSGLMRLVSVSKEKAAATSVYLAGAPEVEKITGGYWARCKRKRSSKISYNRAVAKRLWKISEELTGVDFK